MCVQLNVFRTANDVFLADLVTFSLVYIEIIYLAIQTKNAAEINICGVEIFL